MNFEELNKEIELLSEELSKLNVSYTASLKGLNISEEVLNEKKQDIKNGNIPNELKGAFAEAQEAANKAGNSRKAIQNADNTTATTSKRRQGAMRV